MIDDSIVRGTTCKKIVKLLRDAGATEVHVRVTAPPFIAPCHYGTDIDDKEVWDINREKAFLAPERIRLVTEYILNRFDQKTYRGDKTYSYNVLQNIAEVASANGKHATEEIKRKQRISGFNSIFAVSSVDAAKLYYAEFKKQMEEDPTKKLKIAHHLERFSIPLLLMKIYRPYLFRTELKAQTDLQQTQTDSLRNHSAGTGSDSHLNPQASRTDSAPFAENSIFPPSYLRQTG